MATKIRLTRRGGKKHPFYRIVVMDERAPRDSAHIERLGHYDPMVEPPDVVLDKEKAREWLSKGAQPTDVVKQLFKKQGVYEQPTGE